MKNLFLLILLVSVHVNVFGWGTDVLVGPQATGKATIVSTSNGNLYCSIPEGLTGVGGLRIFESTDHGSSWQIVGTIIQDPIMKSKLVVTGTDSVYCLYQVGNELWTYSLAADSSTPFSIIMIDDFDAVGSPNNNSIYVFTDDFNSAQMHRYSSFDGGYTWAGSTALVESSAAHPALAMSGTRLVVTYYGPVLTDTAASVIRVAFYDEGSPGQISPGTFQDILNNSQHHRTYGIVKNGMNVWLIYTEGDSSQTLNYLFSSDDGVNYSPANFISGGPNVIVECFDGCSYSDVTGAGIHIVFYSESNGVRQMKFISATNTAPTTFSPEEIFNDFDPQCFAFGGQPSVTGFQGDVGVIWQEDSSFLATYFDLRSANTRINNVRIENNISVYPNPFTNYITIIGNSTNDKIVLLDITGSVAKYFTVNSGYNILDVSDIPSGIYFMQNQNKIFKIIVKL